MAGEASYLGCPSVEDMGAPQPKRCRECAFHPNSPEHRDPYAWMRMCEAWDEDGVIFKAGRKPEWDGKAKITLADWLRAEMSIPCNRCDEHCSVQEGARAVGDEAVCPDCLTLDDLDLVDPARAAELREEAAADA